MASSSVVISEPKVLSLRSASVPSIPESLKLVALTDPSTLETAQNYPVVVWGDYTYWPFSYIDNRVSMCLVAYDSLNQVLNQWELVGSRYVVSVTVDKAAQQIIFLGQSSATVRISWTDAGNVRPRAPQYFWIVNARASPNQACSPTADMRSIRLADRDISDDQLWLVDNGRQAIFLHSKPDICFDHDEAGRVLLAQTNWGRTHQRWIISSAGQIKPVASDLVLATEQSSIVLEAPSATASDNQLWYVKPYIPSPGLSTDQLACLVPGHQTFMLSNGQYQFLSSTGSGPLTLVPLNHDQSSFSSTTWLYSEGGVLINATNGLAITAGDGLSVVASEPTGRPEQQWALTAFGHLVCKANGRLLVGHDNNGVLVDYDALAPQDQVWFLQLQEAGASSQTYAPSLFTTLSTTSSSSPDNITKLTVIARLSDDFWAGTTDKIYVRLGQNSAMNLTLLFSRPSRGDAVTVNIDLKFMFNKPAINLRDINIITLWQEGVHPIASDAWKLASIILKAKDEVKNREFTNYTFQKVDQWLDNHSPALRQVWGETIPLGAWLDVNQKPVDLNGDTYPVGWIPYIGDLKSWREYDPSKIDGVGQILGMQDGRLIGELLKPPRKLQVLNPTDDRYSYTWVLTPNGSIIYKLWDKHDTSEYIRHSQLGSGNPVICAGEMQMKQKLKNYTVTDVIAMVNDASGHYKPDGGACLRYVQMKMQELGIDTDDITWYSR